MARDASRGSAGPTDLPRQVKLAEQVARRLEDRILSEGWTVGVPLGSEAALAMEMGISRWSFREAIRILEQDGLVVSRRGGGGGLFVAAPIADFVRNGLSHYLDYLRPDPVDILRSWAALEGRAIFLAIERIDADGRATLCGLAETVRRADLAEGLGCVSRIREILADAGANAAIALFTAAISRMVMHATWHSSLDDTAYRSVLVDIVGLAADQAEAVGAGEISDALNHTQAYLEKCGQLLRASFLTDRGSVREGATERAWEIYPAIRPTKKAEIVASEIRDAILQAGWPAGWNMGTEADLMTRFGVGRSVLREAIRALERLGVVRMGRGAASGLTVIAPDPAQVVATCRRHLRRSGITHAALADARHCLIEPPAADSRTDRMTELFLSIIAQDRPQRG